MQGVFCLYAYEKRYDCLSRVRRRVRPNKRIYSRRQNIIFGAPTSLFSMARFQGVGEVGRSSVLDSILLRRKPWRRS